MNMQGIYTNFATRGLHHHNTSKNGRWYGCKMGWTDSISDSFIKYEI